MDHDIHSPQANGHLVFTVKYLGLLAMSKILKTHPKSVQSHKDLILQCLDDKDESIRLRALDLLYGMVCATRTLQHLGHSYSGWNSSLRLVGLATGTCPGCR